MSVDLARRKLKTKESKLADLQKKLATDQSKLASATKKANTSREATNKTRSDSTRRTKIHAYELAIRNMANIQKNISTLQKQIANAEKEVQSAKISLAKEEKRASASEERAIKRASQELDQKLNTIDRFIDQHEGRIKALESEASSVTVLYLGVSPENKARLRADAEARDTREAIRLSENPNAIVFEDRWAVRQNDLLQALNGTNPDFVHFSGYGAFDGSLAIEDPDGEAFLISKETVAAAIEAAPERVRLVVFNACFSDEQADKVLEHVDAVIGMSVSITNSATAAH